MVLSICSAIQETRATLAYSCSWYSEKWCLWRNAENAWARSCLWVRGMAQARFQLGSLRIRLSRVLASYGRRGSRLPHRQSRTGRATFTASWLLSVRSLVNDTSRLVSGNTCHVFGGFLIVAVSMVDPFVTTGIFSAQGSWDALIDF